MVKRFAFRGGLMKDVLSILNIGLIWVFGRPMGFLGTISVYYFGGGAPQVYLRLRFPSWAWDYLLWI